MYQISRSRSDRDLPVCIISEKKFFAYILYRLLLTRFNNLRFNCTLIQAALFSASIFIEKNYFYTAFNFALIRLRTKQACCCVTTISDLYIVSGDTLDLFSAFCTIYIYRKMETSTRIVRNTYYLSERKIICK